MPTSNSKPVILVLASTFPRWKNDTEPRFVYDLCRHLSDQFEVLVLTPHHAGALKYELWDGLKIYRYWYAPQRLEKLVYDGGIMTNLANSPWKWLLVPPFFLFQLIAILRLIRQFPISAIHAHWLIPQAFLALIAKRISGSNIQVISTSHGTDLFGLQGKLTTWIKAWVIRSSDRMTVVSNAMKAEALRIEPKPKNPVEVIPMGTDLQRTFYRHENATRDKNLIVFAGRLIEQKGVDVLIHAMSLITQKFPAAKLVIIGSGPELSAIKTLINQFRLKHSVELVGSVSHQELATWFNRAQMAVFPFREEGFGLVVVEAMGCGTPVIVGDVPAIHDVVTNKKTGLIVPSDDPNNVATAISTLLSDQQLCSTLAQRARSCVAEKYDWAVTSEKYSMLMKSGLL